MALADDFNAAMDKLTGAVNDGVTEIKAEADKIAQLASQAGVDPAVVQAGITRINALADGLTAATAAAKQTSGT